MDARRFDALTQTIGRRGLLGAAVGLVGSTLLPEADAPAQTTACGRQEGSRCRRGGDCCSGSCKQKKKQRKGRCACSALLKPCFDNFDCCDATPGTAGSIVCSSKDGFSDIVCCVSVTGACESSADCCDELECSGAGVCGT